MSAIRVILKKSWTHKLGKRYPVGTVLQCDKVLSNDLISKGIGELYTGKYPPNGKVKTDFFKQKR